MFNCARIDDKKFRGLFFRKKTHFCHILVLQLLLQRFCRQERMQRTYASSTNCILLELTRTPPLVSVRGMILTNGGRPELLLRGPAENAKYTRTL